MPESMQFVKAPELVKLDLACGQSPREGFHGVDLSAPNAQKVNLLEFPWPWADSSVDEVHCSHFIEHIPMEYIDGKDLFFAFFDELWRVLKPNGKATIIWPALKSDRAFQDPTHRRFIPATTMAYLSRSWRETNKLDHYNVRCDFGSNVAPTVPSELMLLHPEAQARRFNESWNTTFDYVATLTAAK